MARNLKRLEDAQAVISYGKPSGAVGTFANIFNTIESATMKNLGPKPADVST